MKYTQCMPHPVELDARGTLDEIAIQVAVRAKHIARNQQREQRMHVRHGGVPLSAARLHFVCQLSRMQRKHASSVSVVCFDSHV